MSKQIVIVGLVELNSYNRNITILEDANIPDFWGVGPRRTTLVTILKKQFKFTADQGKKMKITIEEM